jgi:hypothetical protein
VPSIFVRANGFSIQIIGSHKSGEKSIDKRGQERHDLDTEVNPGGKVGGYVEGRYTEQFYTPHAQILRDAMSAAREELDRVHASYQHVLARTRDASVTGEGMLALRREGQAYAQAVTRYSNAAMAWLAYVETQARPYTAGGAG